MSENKSIDLLQRVWEIERAIERTEKDQEKVEKLKRERSELIIKHQDMLVVRQTNPRNLSKGE